MKMFNQREVKKKIDIIDLKINEGNVFIYPTDTIYGIGCDATNSDSVKKIRVLKNRNTKPFSIIAPSKEWIKENCVINDNVEHWIDKLPGPYTLILEIRKKDAIASEVNCGLKTIGVRIPAHWISDVVAKSEKPIVTTSANKQGQDFMTKIDDLDVSIKNGVDYIFYEGECSGKPSILVNLVDGEIKER